MRYLLDTDIIVDHLRRKRVISNYILEGGGAISIITLGELIYGAHKSNNPDAALVKIEESLGTLGLEVRNLSQLIIEEFGKLKADLEKKGNRLEDFDLLIAATAKVSSLTLVTRNIDHFKRIKGLDLIDKLYN